MRTALALAGALACLTGAAQPASAATATKSGATVTYDAAPAELNRLSITVAGADFLFDETIIAITDGGGCPITAGNARCPTAGVTRIVVRLQDEGDELDADTLTVAVTAEGGDGNDDLDGGDGPDAIDGGPGNDLVFGRGGPDQVNGGSGLDGVRGNDGADVLHGDDGSDLLEGGAETDQLFGDGGDDAFTALEGADDISGGAGVDAFVLIGGSLADPPVALSLDDVANDGPSGVNVRTDVESIEANFVGEPFFGSADIVGSDAANSLRGGAGHDSVDGRGGVDFLGGGGGDDRVAARDGAFDNVACGDGADFATVDFVDLVAECENVDRAPEPAPVDSDRPPSVAFVVAPAPAVLAAPAPTPITVDATDDRGVAQVVLLDDSGVVGTDTEAPYAFDLRPGAGDVGANTLIAVATDTAGQTATAFRELSFDRFAGALTVAPRRARDRRRPFAWRGSGRLATAAAPFGCTGQVTLTLRRGNRVLLTRRIRLKRDCTFAFTLRLKRRAKVGNGRLALGATFGGNDLVGPAAARTALRAG